jgi:hypothetical protein
MACMNIWPGHLLAAYNCGLRVIIGSIEDYAVHCAILLPGSCLDKADYHFRSTGCVQDGCTTVFMTSENSADNRYRFEDSYRSALSGELVPRWWVVADTNIQKDIYTATILQYTLTIESRKHLRSPYRHQQVKWTLNQQYYLSSPQYKL